MKTIRNIIRKELSIVNCQLSIVHFPLSIVHCQWPLALLLLVAAGASAQTVTNARWNPDGTVLTVDYDLVPQEDVKSNYSYIVTPMLCSPTDTLALEPQVWRGAQNARKLHRAHILNKVDEGSYLPLGEMETVHRTSAFSANDVRWLKDSPLSMAFRLEMEGCCDVIGGDVVASALPAYVGYQPHFVYLQPQVEAVKTRALSGQAFIDFVVNRTDIRPDYRGNAAELQKIQNTIDSVRNDADIQVRKITIKGFASPEGGYQANDRLAAGRTEALKNYVAKLYDFPASAYETDHVAEDWDGLVAYLETSDLGSRDEILDIIRNSGLEPDAMEWRIKSRHQRDYQYLLQNVYPGLRHSDYRIEYVIRGFSDIDEIKQLVKTQPQKLSLQEFFLAAQEYQAGSSDFNEVWDTALRMYPQDETANLNAAVNALSRGDLSSAQGCLQKAGNSAHAQYARGVLAALQKDYTGALSLFRQAQQGGMSEAADAIAQMQRLLGN